MVGGSVVGALFADRTFSGETVDTVARDVVGLLAEGFGYALERTMLLGRMRDQIGKIREMMAETNTTLDDMFEAGMSMQRDETTGDIDIVGRGPVMPVSNASRLMGLLTRREIEVIDLMARGASNPHRQRGAGHLRAHSEVAREAHPAGSNAANRAQAVSCYMRLQALSKN